MNDPFSFLRNHQECIYAQSLGLLECITSVLRKALIGECANIIATVQQSGPSVREVSRRSSGAPFVDFCCVDARPEDQDITKRRVPIPQIYNVGKRFAVFLEDCKNEEIVGLTDRLFLYTPFWVFQKI